MTEKAYTKNEIDLMLAPIDGKLDQILEQTTRHNGRMSKLEAWRSYIMGGISILVVVLLPILIWALNTLVNIDRQVQDGIKRELSTYNVSVE